jgi:hypothetical protein
MIYKIIFVIFIGCKSILGQVPSTYYLYGKEQLNLNDVSFRRYALPQLKAMTQEFYHILRKLHPLHDDLIKQKSHLNRMSETYQDFQENCPEVSPDCLDRLKGLYLQSRRFDQMALDLQERKISFNKVKDQEKVNALLTLTGTIDKMANQNYRLMHKIEEYLITTNTTYFPYFDGKKEIYPILNKMKLSSELNMTILLEPKYRKEFDFVRAHFFRQIEFRVVSKKDKKYFLKRLEELNIAWNTFHMKMTKGSNPLPRSLTKFIKIMHNRWNSVLKIILNTRT